MIKIARRGDEYYATIVGKAERSINGLSIKDDQLVLRKRFIPNYFYIDTAHFTRSKNGDEWICPCQCPQCIKAACD